MELNCQVNIVDAIMGSGKTQGVINMINDAPEEEKFLVITPYLNEIERYKAFCPDRHFKAPTFANGTSKLEDITKLIQNGENIVSTHALFIKFDDTVIDACRSQGYTLIMDEVADVVEQYEISFGDLRILQDELVDVDQETGKLNWRNDIDTEKYHGYHGNFSKEKELCQKNMLVTYGENLVVRLFPIEVFNAFRNIYILTYRFDLQIQRYYYDFFGLKYKYLSVEGDSLDTYRLIKYDPDISYIKYDYKNLIHITGTEKMNSIGDRRRDLSKAWYERNHGSITMKILQNNLANFFRNIRNDRADENLWTTFKKYEPDLKGKGYSKCFLPLNARATNEYRDRISIAYPVNRFLNPYLKNFFSMNGIEIDEDGYALTEMLQFIWRSAIRDGKEIWIYMPSVRMRGLLEQWIEDNPLVNKEDKGE